MNKLNLICSAAAALVIVCLTTADVKAQGPYAPYWGNGQQGIYGGNFGVGGDLFRSGAVPAPPYFSLFPPVYYGERFQRPYGLSPIASAAQVKVPDSYRGRRHEGIQPQITRNPYCAAPPAEELPEAAATAQNVILNPFASSAVKLTDAR